MSVVPHPIHYQLKRNNNMVNAASLTFDRMVTYFLLFPVRGPILHAGMEETPVEPLLLRDGGSRGHRKHYW